MSKPRRTRLGANDLVPTGSSGGGQTSTSVFNMVLNTIGASSFGQSMGRAQDSINKVTLSVNRATQAAKTGRVSAELQRTQQEKLNASFALSAARLDVFRDKLQSSAGALGNLQKRQGFLNAEIADQTNTLAKLNTQLARMQANGKNNASAQAQWKAKIAATTQSLSQLTAEQASVNKRVTDATGREKLYQAQLRAREARLAAMKAKMEEVQKPLSRFESFVATAMQLYNAFNKINTVWEKFSKNVDRTMRIVEKLQGFLGRKSSDSMGGGLASTGGLKLPDLGGTITKAASGLSFLGATAAHVLGGVILNGLTAVTNGFVSLARAAVSSVSSFEQLNLSFKALLAVQATNKDSTLKLNDALDQSGVMSAKLIKWLEKLAILSPFSAEDVKNAFQNAMAMGFTTDEAARLTKATLDWAAATGKSGSQAEHAVYVMGQMRSAGKLLYQDLYQLAQLGIGMDQINRALAKSLGKSVDEIKRMREAGQITAAQGVTAITQFMEQFQGAAAAQAHTLTGLMASLGDLGPILLRSFFGPMDEASGKIEGFLGVIQRRLDSFVTFIQSEWLLKNLTAFGKVFGNLTENAFVWGENVVTQFANGMLSALWTVMDALTNVGNLIATWLTPGSPPKLLPDLDKWGAGAMLAYMDGFTSALQGDLFNDLAGTMENYLQSLPETIMADIDFVPTVMAMRTSLAALLSGNGSFEALMATLGSAGPTLSGYVTTLLELSKANESVEAAQKKVNDITKQYDDQINAIVKKQNAKTEAAQYADEEKQIKKLTRIANDARASTARKKKAQDEIDAILASRQIRSLEAQKTAALEAAQTELDAEIAKQELAQKAFEQQRLMLSAQEKNNSLLEQQISLLERLAKEGAGAGGGAGTPLTVPFSLAGTTPFDAGGGGKDVASASEFKMESIKQMFLSKLKDMQEAWTTLWNEKILPIFEPLKSAWGRVTAAWDKFTGAISEDGPKIQEAIAKTVAAIIDMGAKHLPGVLDTVTRIINTMTRIWEKHGDTIIAVISFTFRLVAGAVLLALVVMVGIIEWGMGLIEKIMDGVSAFLLLWADAPWKAIWAGIQFYLGLVWQFITNIFNIIMTVLFNFYVLAVAWVVTLMTALYGMWIAGLTALTEGIQWWIEAIQTAWALFKVNLINKAIEIKNDVTEKFTLLKTAAYEKIRALAELLVEKLAAIKKEFGDRFTEAKDKVVEIAGLIYDAVSGKIGEIVAYLTSPDLIANFVSAGSDFVQGIIDGIANMAGALATAIANLVSGMFSTAQEEGEQHSPSQRAAREVGKPYVQGIVKGIESQMAALDKAVIGSMDTMVAPPASAAMIGQQAVYNNSSTVNYNYAPTYRQGPVNPSADFRTMQVLGG